MNSVSASHSIPVSCRHTSRIQPMVCVWVAAWQVKLRDPLVTHRQYLSSLKSKKSKEGEFI